MALIPSARYPGNTDIAVAYPQGKARNAGGYQDGTGTPLEKDWVNDLFGFEQALLADAGIVPSGSPDQVGASQYLAAVQAISARAAVVRQFLFAWGNISFATAPPSAYGLAAVFDPVLLRTLLLKGGGSTGSFIVGDDMWGTTLGQVGSLGMMEAAAYDPVGGRVVAVTNYPSTGIAYSNDFGATFTNSPTGVLRNHVVWDSTHSLFLATNHSQANVYTSPTGVTWTSRALTAANRGGIAVLSTGRGCSPIGLGPTLAFNTSTNGTTWTLSAGTLPDVANATSFATTSVVSLGTKFYDVNIFNPGAQLRIHSSPDASVWTLVSTITPVLTPISDPVLLADAYSGALYVLSPTTSGGWYIYASLDLGVTWFGPSRIEGNSPVKAAGGRLWTSENASVRCTVNRLPAA